MKRFFFIILFLLTVNRGFSQAVFIKDRENQNIVSETYDSLTNTIYFLADKDSLNQYQLWFNFGVTGFRKDTILTFKSEFFIHQEIDYSR